MERDRVGQGIQMEIVGEGRVRLTIPGVGDEILQIPRVPQDISKNELAALSVMKLAISKAYPEETTGVDQAGYMVRREEDIHTLPGGREQVPKDALKWAGSVLMRGKWSAQRVADLLISDLEHIGTGLQLGTITKDRFNQRRAGLRHTIASFYPGGISGQKRRKPEGDW